MVLTPNGVLSTLARVVRDFMCLNINGSMSIHVHATSSNERHGVQACCLWCDEPDEGGSSRCKGCIEFHSRIREEIAKAPAEDAAEWDGVEGKLQHLER